MTSFQTIVTKFIGFSKLTNNVKSCILQFSTKLVLDYTTYLKRKIVLYNSEALLLHHALTALRCKTRCLNNKHISAVFQITTHTQAVRVQTTSCVLRSHERCVCRQHACTLQNKVG